MHITSNTKSLSQALFCGIKSLNDGPVVFLDDQIQCVFVCVCDVCNVHTKSLELLIVKIKDAAILQPPTFEYSLTHILIIL